MCDLAPGFELLSLGMDEDTWVWSICSWSSREEREVWMAGDLRIDGSYGPCETEDAAEAEARRITHRDAPWAQIRFEVLDPPAK